MVWTVLFILLAAWGLLCALWAGLGWLLPGSRDATLVLLCGYADPVPAIARCRWLRSLGLLHGRLIAAVPSSSLARLQQQYHDLELWGLEALTDRLEAERKRFD